MNVKSAVSSIQIRELLKNANSFVKFIIAAQWKS